MIIIKLLLFCGAFVFSFGEHHHDEEPRRARIIQPEPGMLARYNKLGFERYFDISIRTWTRSLLRRQLPTVEKDNYLITFNLTSVDLGSNSFDTATPNSITHRTRDASAHVTARWMYFSGGEEHSGTTIIDISGIRVDNQVLYHVRESGVGKLEPGECIAAIEDIDFEISPRSPAVELGVEIIGKLLETEFEKQVCGAVTEEFNFFFLILLGWHDAELPINFYFPTLTGYKFNTMHTRAPLIDDNGITFFTNAYIYNVDKNPQQRIPFQPAPAPSLSRSRQMVQLLFTEFFFNTLNYAQWQDGVFDAVLNETMVQLKMGIDMSASALADDFPIFAPFVNRTLEYEIVTVEYPRTKINESGIFTTEIQHVRVNAVMENGTRTTVYEYDSETHSVTQLYIFNHNVHRRIVDYYYTTRESSPERLFERGIPTLLLQLNDQYARETYMGRTFTRLPLELVGVTITLIEGGVDYGADMRLRRTMTVQEH